jgi:hypothetical protein
LDGKKRFSDEIISFKHYYSISVFFNHGNIAHDLEGQRVITEHVHVILFYSLPVWPLMYIFGWDCNLQVAFCNNLSGTFRCRTSSPSFQLLPSILHPKSID